MQHAIKTNTSIFFVQMCVEALMCGSVYLDADGPAFPVQFPQHGADERRLTAADLPNHTDQRPVLHRQGDATTQSKNKNNQKFTGCIYFALVPSPLGVLKLSSALNCSMSPLGVLGVRVGTLHPGCTCHLTVGNHAAGCTYSLRVGTPTLGCTYFASVGAAECTYFVSVGTPGCTYFVSVGTPGCTYFVSVGTPECTYFVSVGTPECTYFVSVGTPECTYFVSVGTP